MRVKVIVNIANEAYIYISWNKTIKLLVDSI